MSSVHRELAERIRGELVDLTATMQRAGRSWERAGRVPDEQDVYLEPVELNLDPQRMNPLMVALPGAWQQVHAELAAFAGFLEEVGQGRD